MKRIALSHHKILGSAVIMPAIPQAPPVAETMYQVHAQQVARWAERLAGPSLEVEDIVHEVFAIAYERVHQFRGESSLSTWLFGITDMVVRHRRRKERWRRWLRGSADETAGHLASDSPDALHLVESHQNAVAVYRVLDRLPERDRQILVLCHMEELSSEEASRLLGVCQANVRLRLHRARARFTRAYQEFVKQSQRRSPP